MIYLLTTPITFTPQIGERVVRYHPSMDFSQFSLEDVVVVGMRDKAKKLVDLTDQILCFVPNTLDIWIVDEARWVAVRDRAGNWIQEVPAPFDLEEYSESN